MHILLKLLPWSQAQVAEVSCVLSGRLATDVTLLSTTEDGKAESRKLQLVFAVSYQIHSVFVSTLIFSVGVPLAVCA